MHFTANDRRTLLQSEYISHEYVTLAQDLHDVGDLDDRVSLSRREFSCFCRAFNVEAEDAKRWEF